jgi:tRNA threonylcarbamoyladenosine biosynthesis protein TsaB
VGPADSWELEGASPEAAPLLLAIDTSSRVGGIAFYRGEVLAEQFWLAGGSQTAQLVPSLVKLGEQSGLAIADVRAVAVAIGPGSFTGLRVGASLGKGLALSLGIPLIGVPTLDTTAYQHRQVSGSLLAVVSAGRGMLYTGTYRSSARGLRRVGEFASVTTDELVSQVLGLGTSTFVCGELDRGAVLALQNAASMKVVRMVGPAGRLRRAGFLAELGYWNLLTHGATDPATLQPIYLRRGEHRSS